MSDEIAMFCYGAVYACKLYFSFLKFSFAMNYTASILKDCGNVDTIIGLGNLGHEGRLKKSLLPTLYANEG